MINTPFIWGIKHTDAIFYYLQLNIKIYLYIVYVCVYFTKTKAKEKLSNIKQTKQIEHIFSAKTQL